MTLTIVTMTVQIFVGPWTVVLRAPPASRVLKMLKPKYWM